MPRPLTPALSPMNRPPVRHAPPLARAAFALLAALAVFSPLHLGAQTARPKVLVIATGGTIAGVQDAPGTLGRYRAGTLTAEQIITSVPELSRYAQVEAEQFSNVASTYITPEQWVALSKRINTVLRERRDGRRHRLPVGR